SNTGCINPYRNTYSTADVAGTGYQWMLTGGYINQGNGTSTIAVTWTQPGTQTITLTATNATTGCDSTVTLPVLVDSITRPVIQPPNLNGCEPFDMSFSGNISNPN